LIDDDDDDVVPPNSGPGVLLRIIGAFVGRVSRALRVNVVCRSNVYTESGENSVLANGTGFCIVFDMGIFVVGNGVRERSGSVSATDTEPNGVGVLLRGLSIYLYMNSNYSFFCEFIIPMVLDGG